MASQEEVKQQIKQFNAKMDEEISKGPTQIKKDQEVQLRRDYLAAQADAARAPAELLRAKEAYDRSRLGAAYTAQTAAENQTIATTRSREYEDAHKLRVENANDAFLMYKGAFEFAASSFKDYVQSIELHIASVTNSGATAQYHTTTLRKTFYLEKEFDTIRWWDTAFTLLVVSVSLVFAYDKFVVQGLYRKIFLWFLLLLLLTSAYFLPMIINLLVHMPQPVNIYSSWAQTDQPEWHGTEL